MQKYGENLKLPNFSAKKFKESLFFCKKREENRVLCEETCNFAAIYNENEDEKKYISTDMCLLYVIDDKGSGREKS